MNCFLFDDEKWDRLDVRGLVWMCCGCERVGVDVLWMCCGCAVDVRGLVWMCCGCERVGVDVLWM